MIWTENIDKVSFHTHVSTARIEMEQNVGDVVVLWIVCSGTLASIHLARGACHSVQYHIYNIEQAGWPATRVNDIHNSAYV